MGVLMPASAALIVVAAGTGRRLGGPVHKALVPLDGRPLVEHTLRRLLASGDLDPVVLVGHADDRDALNALIARLPRPVTLVEGGARRQDSVSAGLAALGNGPDVVLIHDAARPFVPLERLPTLVEAARNEGCAILAVPVADTIKESALDDHEHVGRTLRRENLWAAQTPQAFRRTDLIACLAEAERTATTVTDEARLFESAGLAVRFVEGSPLNFKVTTPDDLRLARALLERAERDATP